MEKVQANMCFDVVFLYQFPQNIQTRLHVLDGHVTIQLLHMT